MFQQAPFAFMGYPLNIHTMWKKLILLMLSACMLSVVHANPVKGLLERIDPGASGKFVIEQQKSPVDFFELDQQGTKVVVRGNNYVSIATGINWYLKYHAGIHLSWNGMTAKLPETLPAVKERERHETALPYRYAFNYCTFSYSMAFWDWQRWEKEIDWMALHGVNMSLALTGAETVWQHVLEKLGYTQKEINDFVSGPGFTAWWLMNNLEGWGGPNPDSWYTQQAALQKKIVKRMREYGIEPILPGYCGMVPNNAKDKLGLNVSDPGLWCSYRRPAFLQPEDERFEEISSIYYKELTKLYGKAKFYAIDPFHEGGSSAGVNLDAAGKAIMKAMKKANPKAVWVAQAWQNNPRVPMIQNLKEGDMLVLDLHAECRPQWGDSWSEWCRKDGFLQHDWLYCMLLNFGGNVGLHGKMDILIDGFYRAQQDVRAQKTLKGVGMTPEGIENNPVMYELLFELPWRSRPFTKEEWVEGYVKARYGTDNATLQQVWKLLSNSIYNSPKEKVQQGTTESLFCARPGLDVEQASSWAETKDYYHGTDVMKAAWLMASVADEYKGNNNFEYDLVDLMRQALAEKGRAMLKAVKAAYESEDPTSFNWNAKRFLQLLLAQDRLLGTRPEFRVGSWVESARNIGHTEAEKDLYEWNARVQISCWGNRVAADQGGLHDYAHKEWQGILKDLYYQRWKAYFDQLALSLEGQPVKELDYFAMEEAWSKQKNHYSSSPEGEVVEVVKELLDEWF